MKLIKTRDLKDFRPTLENGYIVVDSKKPVTNKVLVQDNDSNILLTCEESKTLLECGKVEKLGYKGHDYLITLENGHVQAYAILGNIQNCYGVDNNGNLHPIKTRG